MVQAPGDTKNASNMATAQEREGDIQAEEEKSENEEGSGDF